MDIEGNMTSAREAELATILEAERLRSRITESASLLRKAFSEFTDTLVRYKVPQSKLVRLERKVVPATRGLFRSAPSDSRMTATVLGLCWPFQRTLLFRDGAILGDDGALRGSQVVPNDPYGFGDKAAFLKLALPALSQAGLSGEFSNDCIYIVNIERNPAQPLKNRDWSKIQGSEIAGGNMAGGIELRVHRNQYVVTPHGQIFIEVDDGRDDGHSVERPLDQVFAGYINAAMPR